MSQLFSEAIEPVLPIEGFSTLFFSNKNNTVLSSLSPPNSTVLKAAAHVFGTTFLL